MRRERGKGEGEGVGVGGGSIWWSWIFWRRMKRKEMEIMGGDVGA